MNNKGFTLIELLAVIVILAIIALIATPIILGIINDAKQESDERSVELYASAIQNASARYQLDNKKAVSGNFITDDGKILVSEEDENIKLNVEYTGEVMCDVIELYSDGTIYLENCKVKDGKNVYNYGQSQDKLVKFSDVCKPVAVAASGTYTIGDKYSCEVKENVWYTFYVLNTSEAKKISLIMDSNVNRDGSAVQSGTKSDTSAYVDVDTYKEIGEITDQMLSQPACGDGGICVSGIYGPISANNYLKDATSTWTNVGKLVLSDFVDKQGKTHKIMAAARLPRGGELAQAGCPASTICPSWLTTNKPSNVREYWFESEKNNSNMTEYFDLNIGSRSGYYSWSEYGIRPVITLSL